MATFGAVIARAGDEAALASLLIRNVTIGGSALDEDAAKEIGLELFKLEARNDLWVLEDTIDAFPIENWDGDKCEIVGWEIEASGTTIYPWEFED